jgi:hypothetical protein
MGEFLQANWFWMVLLGLFFWMHSSGMGCGGHGGHGGHDYRQGHDRDDDDEPRRRNQVTEHQH